ncbi:MAG: MerR family transcriptional regulator [Desulfomonile tiedjei]|nr:MerR family transcriptional regulator [Desulfomonile tiedjei]
MAIAIPEKQYFKIGEVSEILDVEPYVLRYWESEFKILKPTRTRARQRLYHKKDLELLMEIKHLLYDEKFTIAGAKKRLQEMKKQSSAERKAKKPAKPVRGKEEVGEVEFKSNNSPPVSQSSDYKDILIEIKKELKELRAILEG